MEALNEIRTIRKQIPTLNWKDPVVLTETAMKLALAKSDLADEISGLHKDATDSAHQIFLTSRKMQLGVTESEQIAKAESTDKREAYENALTVNRATSDLITTMRVHAKAVAEQRQREEEV